MINRLEWELLAAENHLAQPLDAMLMERLAQALPDKVRPDFRTGAELLCASLNRGDAYLPLDQKEFAATVRNWLALPGPGQRAGDVCGYLTRQMAAFKRGLDKNKFAAVVCGPENPVRPLVYDRAQQRLYFERYFEAVHIINGALSGRIGPFPFGLPEGG